MNKYKIFLNSILNEISIEKDILNRLNRVGLGYTPLRTLKLLPVLDKYKVKRPIYLFINLLYLVGLPFFYFYKLLKSLALNKNCRPFSYYINKKIVLLSNSKIYSLSKHIYDTKNITYIDINQNTTLSQLSYISIYNILGYFDYFKAFSYSIIGSFYVLINLKDKTNMLQTYVSYDWFLTYIALNKIKIDINEVTFANHYDRWATMFDQIFALNKITLIQHGLLPKNLKLSYKLRNLNIIFRYNQQSETIFKQIFTCDSVNFRELNSSIVLTPIDGFKNTILIIGQPHSIEKEVEIIAEFIKNGNYDIYIKPHPLFGIDKYKKLQGVHLIKDKNFFPKVDIALCYESTLGLEYESSGVKVFWHKGVCKTQTINKINQILDRI